MLHRTVAVAVGVFVCLVSFEGRAAEPRDSGIASPLESLPQSIWEVDLDSTAYHLQTGLACPYDAGGLTLQRVMNFDEVGLDVACNYVAPAGDVVTVYLTMRDQQTLEDDLARADMELLFAFDDAAPVAASETPQLPPDIRFLASLYSLPQRNAHSGIWVADYSGWTLKFRATYPANDPLAAAEAMLAILDAAEGARSHLALCAKSPIAERNGQPVTEASEAYGIGTIGIAGHFASRDTPPPDPVWCVESVLETQAAPLLVWRNIGERDASMAVLRLTAFSPDRLPYWRSFPAALPRRG